MNTPLPPASADHDKLLRLADVVRITSLSASTIYRYVARGIFPAQIRVGSRCSRWLESEVRDWVARQKDQALIRRPVASTGERCGKCPLTGHGGEGSVHLPMS